jgi:hypothetical protein
MKYYLTLLISKIKMGACFSKSSIPLLTIPGPLRVNPEHVSLYYPFPNPNGNQTAIVVAPAYYSSLNKTVPNPHFNGFRD